MSSMKKCEININTEKEKPVIELIGDCDDTENRIMAKLAPYAQKYWGMFIVKKPAPTTPTDSSSK